MRLSIETLSSLLDQTARLLRRLGLGADGASVVGLALTALTGALIAQGQFIFAAFAGTAGGLFDLLDGRIARLSGSGTRAGAVLDSTLDRYGDAFLYGGIIAWFARAGEPLYAVMAFSACVGAFAVSYVRARSEGLGRPCQVGFWERGERFALILVALASCSLHLMILYLGVLTHLTAAERLIYARRAEPCAGRSAFRTWILHEGGRRTPAYWVKAGFFVASVLLVRL